ncbi:hypothetical protein [Aeromicrobium sp. CTD01-1L150]|uniref:hypothetical protein n=1 Tax=Aeromicrobium sp. CTD01-1L150 TaxID=3341830 RepID=UPI0035C20396
MLVAVCSSKGSPGVTTSALALATAWEQPAVVVEADESGATLPFRLRTTQGQTLLPSRTIASLAAVADRDPSLVRRTAQAVTEQLSVVPGIAAYESGGGMRELWGDLVDVLRVSDVDVIADVGRVNTASRSMAILEAADVVVVVTQADPHEVLHLQQRVSHLKYVLGAQKASQIVPLVVSKRKYARTAVSEVDEVLQVESLEVAPTAFLAWDPTVVDRLYAGAGDAHWTQRTELLRSARASVRSIREIAAEVAA